MKDRSERDSKMLPTPVASEDSTIIAVEALEPVEATSVRSTTVLGQAEALLSLLDRARRLVRGCQRV